MKIDESKFDFEIYNGGSGCPVKIKDIITVLAQNFNKDIEFSFNNQQKEGDPKYLCADLAKVKNLEWEPQSDLTTELKNYVEWFLEQ